MGITKRKYSKVNYRKLIVQKKTEKQRKFSHWPTSCRFTLHKNITSTKLVCYSNANQPTSFQGLYVRGASSVPTSQVRSS
jgi:hypothetical protein